MSNLIERAPRRGELLSRDAIRLAVEVTGGPTLWFLWEAGSGQELVSASLAWKAVPVSLSSPGRNIELGAKLQEEALERWRETTPRPDTPRRRTELGRRLAEIRKRIEASGQPLLSSWEEIDRELADRRGEPLDEPDR